MRATIRIEPTEYIGEPRRKAFEKINSTLADVIPRADVIPAHYSITPRACSRSALRTYLIHIRAPIPFVVVSAHCATERRSQGTIRQRSHFRNRRCLARCRRRLGCAFALRPAEEASSITFQIGRRGSRHQRPLPDRSPTLQAFRSVLSETPSVSTQRLSRLPFVPLSPQSSIPESSYIVSYLQRWRKGVRQLFFRRQLLSLPRHFCRIVKPRPSACAALRGGARPRLRHYA